MKLNKATGRHYDFLPSGGGMTQSVINIIEANTSTQTDVLIVETDVTYTDGVPTQVRKYGDAGKTLLVYTINVVWTNGVPTSVVNINHDDSITKTTVLVWYNGALTNATTTLGTEAANTLVDPQGNYILDSSGNYIITTEAA